MQLSHDLWLRDILWTEIGTRVFYKGGKIVSIYSEIKVVTLPEMRVARYVMVTPNPEQDVISYMDKWAENSGLLEHKGYVPRRIGWDFPFVPKNLTEEFGLRGYVSAYVIPEDFQPKCSGAEIAYINEDTYATLRITDPHSDSFATISQGFKKLFEFVSSGEYKVSTWENRIAFEEEFDLDGVSYMDIFVPAG